MSSSQPAAHLTTSQAAHPHPKLKPSPPASSPLYSTQTSSSYPTYSSPNPPRTLTTPCPPPPPPPRLPQKPSQPLTGPSTSACTCSRSPAAPPSSTVPGPLSSLLCATCVCPPRAGTLIQTASSARPTRLARTALCSAACRSHAQSACSWAHARP